ncbi:MAG: MBL fold metallo-hydrolase [Dehalococcoidia bacterium]|nr:MBL fold metallo-hydrolase [Dehalococcoidia bacterium]MBL7165630.1 MBL fold metallo-hydrolase [Dehalococcoidales bacterium]
MIIRKLEFGPFAGNCYIVGSESTGEGMIIDPATQGEDIVSQVEELGLKVKVIVLTHGHMDHTGALAEVKEATGAEVVIHANDAPYLQNKHPMMQMFSRSSKEMPTPDRLLEDDDTIDIGELRFRVLHTPGHTPGGISLLGEGVVFTGDTLFQFSIGRADFPGASYEEELESIRTRLLTLPDETTVYPGHGPDTTIGIERKINPFLQDDAVF